MKALLDTSVLVATFYGDHERHAPSLETFLRFGKKESCCSVHSLAEVYAALTRMPGRRRIPPSDALLFLSDVRESLSIISLDEHDYVRCLRRALDEDIVGGAIYDALLAACALKAEAETIYTLNTRHFLRFSDVAARVREPE